MSGNLIAKKDFLTNMSLVMIDKKLIFFSLSNQTLGRFPARIFFSLHFTSSSSWVFLPHSELLVSHQHWSLFSRTSFPFLEEVVFSFLGKRA